MSISSPILTVMTPVTTACARSIRIALVLLVATVWPAAAQEAPSTADLQAIQAVISDQISAFRRDDGEAAFAHASPAIRARFQDAGNFMTMVEQAYAPVYRAVSAEFLDIAVESGAVLQEVFLVGPDGTTVKAIYEMERQEDGSWRINGVYLVRSPDQMT